MANYQNTIRSAKQNAMHQTLFILSINWLFLAINVFYFFLIYIKKTIIWTFKIHIIRLKYALFYKQLEGENKKEHLTFVPIFYFIWIQIHFWPRPNMHTPLFSASQVMAHLWLDHSSQHASKHLGTPRRSWRKLRVSVRFPPLCCHGEAAS